MKKTKKAQNRFATERTENRMLMALYAEQAIRHEVPDELRDRL